MGVFDDILSKTKETINVVGKKTGEVVNIQKVKFDISSAEAKREKSFAKLGKLCFAKIKSLDDNSSEVNAVIKEINDRAKELNELNTELARLQKVRFCPKCGSPIDINANFCRSCGARVTFDGTEKKETEN